MVISWSEVLTPASSSFSSALPRRGKKSKATKSETQAPSRPCTLIPRVFDHIARRLDFNQHTRIQDEDNYMIDNRPIAKRFPQSPRFQFIHSPETTSRLPQSVINNPFLIFDVMLYLGVHHIKVYEERYGKIKDLYLLLGREEGRSVLYGVYEAPQPSQTILQVYGPNSFMLVPRTTAPSNNLAPPAAHQTAPLAAFPAASPAIFPTTRNAADIHFYPQAPYGSASVPQPPAASSSWVNSTQSNFSGTTFSYCPNDMSYSQASSGDAAALPEQSSSYHRFTDEDMMILSSSIEPLSSGFSNLLISPFSGRQVASFADFNPGSTNMGAAPMALSQVSDISNRKVRISPFTGRPAVPFADSDDDSVNMEEAGHQNVISANFNAGSGNMEAAPKIWSSTKIWTSTTALDGHQNASTANFNDSSANMEAVSTSAITTDSSGHEDASFANFSANVKAASMSLSTTDFGGYQNASFADFNTSNARAASMPSSTTDSFTNFNPGSDNTEAPSMSVTTTALFTNFNVAVTDRETVSGSTSSTSVDSSFNSNFDGNTQVVSASSSITDSLGGLDPSFDFMLECPWAALLRNP